MTAPAIIATPIHDVTGPDILGVDLSTLPTLTEQLALLDAVRGTDDVEDYVVEWLRISDELHEGASVNWGNHDACDAEGDVMRWVACDSQEADRRARNEALFLHAQQIDGFRAELRRALISRRRFTDNRKTPTREIFAIVRAFLATGGELLAPPNPLFERERIEVKPDTNRFATGDWSEADAIASRAMFRVVRRWRARPVLERIIRMLGDRTTNEWLVLSRFDPVEWLAAYEAVGGYCFWTGEGLATGWKIAGHSEADHLAARQLFGRVHHLPERWATVCRAFEARSAEASA